MLNNILSWLQSFPETLQTIGVVGFVVYIASFKLVQFGKIDGNGVTYALANVLAAALVLISLASAFNLASFLIQISFIAIGLFGVARKVLIPGAPPREGDAAAPLGKA